MRPPVKNHFALPTEETANDSVRQSPSTIQGDIQLRVFRRRVPTTNKNRAFQVSSVSQSIETTHTFQPLSHLSNTSLITVFQESLATMTVVLFRDLLSRASTVQLILLGLMLIVSITCRSTHQYVRPSLGIYVFRHFSRRFLTTSST